MATKVIKVDEDKIRDCKEDIDTLMVFVSLSIDNISSLSNYLEYRLAYFRR